MSGSVRTRERRIWSVKTGRAIRHGVASGYSNHGCGCDECFTAWSGSPGVERERAIYARASEPRTA